MYEKNGIDFQTESMLTFEVKEKTSSSENVRFFKETKKGIKGTSKATEKIEKPLVHKSFSFGKRSQKFSNRNDYFQHNSQQKVRHVNFQDKNKTSLHFNKHQCANYKRKREASEFRFGNYHQYYGYRNQGQMDSRLQCMKSEWFSHKDVLDVGCNAGHLTLTLAKDFLPRSIVGVDIDGELIKMAMRNVRHYVDPESIRDEDFPISFPLIYGPIAQALDPKCLYPDGNFPFNVQFIQGNYVLPSDELLYEQYECFDTVLCLSLTKWIHLNWGDTGIKMLFKRIYYQLRPGGYLILEAQEYKTYARKKKITEEAYKHYLGIKLLPEMFNEYLVKEVGFETYELIDTPAHSSQGFSRPIYLFTKGKNIESSTGVKPKHIIYDDSSDSNCDDSDVEQLSD